MRALTLAAPLALLLALAMPTPSLAADSESANADAPAVLDFQMETLDGETVDLAEKYQEKVVLFVNVASKCGYTRQYAGLQELHARYGDKGLAIVGVPCNQFGGQEPGTAEEIATFCSTTYGVEFDMLAKVEVKDGKGQSPLYAYLTKESPYPGKIGWNFEKFLVGRDGDVLGRYKSSVEPTDPEMIAAIEKALAE